MSPRAVCRASAAARIMLSDVLPNCLSPVIVQATLLLAIGIIIEASVSFVGLGVQPPEPSWGNMLADARNYLFSGEWWLSVFPGACISLSVVAINLRGRRSARRAGSAAQYLGGDGMTEDLLRVDGLHVGFRAGDTIREVVRGVDLRVAPVRSWGWSANPAPARACPRWR